MIDTRIHAGENEEADPRADFDSLLEPIFLPMQMAAAARAWNLQVAHLWARLFLFPLYPLHGHEERYQLEVPDPLAECKEQDLFA